MDERREAPQQAEPERPSARQNDSECRKPTLDRSMAAFARNNAVGTIIWKPARQATASKPRPRSPTASQVTIAAARNTAGSSKSGSPHSLEAPPNRATCTQSTSHTSPAAITPWA